MGQWQSNCGCIAGPRKIVSGLSGRFEHSRSTEDSPSLQKMRGPFRRLLTCDPKVVPCEYNHGGLVAGTPVRPRVWRCGHGDRTRATFQWPEADELGIVVDDTTVGIAFSGGGIRSASQSLGILQALHELELLDRVRYISSVSGGSWTNAPFSYLPDLNDVTSFLAPGVLGPAALTDSVLGKSLPSASMLHALATSEPLQTYIGEGFLDDITCGRRRHLRSWNHAVGEAYLKPFGLFKEGAVMSGPVGSKSYNRASKAIQSSNATVQPMRQSGPYPIINASVIVSTDRACPLEFTPMYCGVPAEERREQVIGGGVVESFGFGSWAPEFPDKAQIACVHAEEVSATPDFFIPLAFAMGTSSSAVPAALKISDDTVGAVFGGATVPMWSPADIKAGYCQRAVVADGNITDNTALLALLRRQVPRVIVNLSAGTPLTDESFLDKIRWLPALFRQGEAQTAGTKVFRDADFDDLFETLEAKIKEGTPAVHEQSLEVLENQRYGVRGGWTVRILWISPNMSLAFKEQLPEGTRSLLEQEPAATFFNREHIHHGFPWVRTDLGSFTPDLVHLLAENSAWQFVQGCGGDSALRQFFGAL